MSDLPKVLRLEEKSRPHYQQKGCFDWEARAIMDKRMPHGHAVFGAMFKKTGAGWKATAWVLVPDADVKQIKWPDQSHPSMLAAAQAIVPEVLTAITSWKAEEAAREDEEKAGQRARIARLEQSKAAVLEVMDFYRSYLDGMRDYNPETLLLVLEVAEKAGIEFTKDETKGFRD